MAYVALAFIAFGLALPAIVGSRNPGVAFRPLAVLSAARDSYSLAAPIPLIPSAGLSLDAGSISIAPSQAASARSGEAILALLTGGSARLILEGAVFTFSTAAKVEAEMTPNAVEGLAPLLMSLTELRFELLSIHHGKVALRQADGGLLQLTDLNAEVSLRRKGTVAAKGTFELRGQIMSFDTTIALGDRKSMYRLPFRALVKGSLLEASIDGRLTLGNGIQISSQNASVAITDLRRTANWLGGAWPDGPGFKKFRVEGNLDLADRDMSFQAATFELDGNVANGTMLIDLTGPRPAIEATLALQKLDLTTYSTPPAEDAAKLALPGKTDGPEGATGEFSLPVIKHLDADLRLSADKVVLGAMSFGRAAASLTLKNGRLLADIAELEIDGAAHGAGQFEVDMAAAEPRYTLRCKIDQLDASRFPAVLFNQFSMRGRANVIADVAATGETGPRLLSTMGGKVTIAMPAGGQLGLDLTELFSTALARSPTIGWGDAAAGHTTVDNFIGRFQITRGLWSAEQLTARSGIALYGGTGAINAPAGTLDLVLTRALALAQAGESGHDPGVALVLRGPWRNPAMQPAERSKPVVPVEPAPEPPIAKAPGGRT